MRMMGKKPPADPGKPIADKACHHRASCPRWELVVEIQPSVGRIVGTAGSREERNRGRQRLVKGSEIPIERATCGRDDWDLSLNRLKIWIEQR